MSEKLEWDSSLSFIFAMIGAAVGLGNIWRFSYVLYSNGGGSFFIPYFTAIAIMGIPFLILEYGVGFSFKESFSKILKDINERFEYIAWALVLFVFIVTIYYMVILSWDMVYLLSSFTFSWGADTAAYFTTTVGGSSDLASAGFLLIPTTICVILMWIVLWYISHKDVDEGIGKVSKVLIPSLFVIMGIIVFYALTLPGHMIGVDALLRPTWSMLLYWCGCSFKAKMVNAFGYQYLASGICSNYFLFKYGSGNRFDLCKLLAKGFKINRQCAYCSCFKLLV